MYLYISINQVSAYGALINQPDLQCEFAGLWGMEGAGVDQEGSRMAEGREHTVTHSETGLLDPQELFGEG